ncbi:adenine deaminase [Microbacterium mangrovi]|uniref:Adenine deaminase n=1 Tax=Microbacterium mangrovi TaxID=1348253 RepID=A0A0B2A317_9MICO|nr:adenosine deaminase [Microbacterium mangrovi]KHK95992.1 adenine deaminase [Microbacterium mangrovi]
MTRPFCELHLHIEGTLEPATIFELAARQGMSLPYADPGELAARYRFSDLQSFLDLYYENMAVLRDEDAFTLMTWAYLQRAHRAGVAHVELFVDPQAHSVRGISEQTVLRGIQRALDRGASELGITSGIIVCVLRDQPVASAHAMLDAVLGADIPVLGMGMDSAEVGYPPSLFAGVFDEARAAGLHVVAHAGEEGPPSYVWEALDVLGAERIDHGIRSLDDAALVARLVRDRIPLTVCPLSNVALKVSPSVAAVPIRRMLDAGLCITINSDDPAYFGGYLDDNLAAIESAHGLTAAELDTLCRNSIEASFVTEERRIGLFTRLGR